MYSAHSIECDPNESFYKSIEREYERNQILLRFNEFCLSNNFKAEYTTETARGKYQVTMIVTKNNEKMYHLSSMVTNSESNALQSVIRKILNLACSINDFGRTVKPPTEVDKRFDEVELCFRKVN